MQLTCEAVYEGFCFTPAGEGHVHATVYHAMYTYRNTGYNNGIARLIVLVIPRSKH
jgi:hypothetical protein